MPKNRAAITGVHGYVPEYVMTNAELETIVDTSDEWIRTRTGISERRILKDEGKATSYLGTQAVQGLLDKTKTAPESVQLIICATITPDTVFPDTANTISANCGMTNAFGFDMSAACSGFLYALQTGAQFIENGTYQKVIIVGAEKMSAILDYTDRTTCVIFGDGAGAILLEPSTDGTGILDAYLRADGTGRDYLQMKAGGSAKPASIETVQNREHFIFQEGRIVFKSAVNGMSSSIKELMTRNDLHADDIAWIVPHQANKRIISVVADMSGFPIERVMINIDRYGNTTAATLPLCLWDYEKQLNKDDNLILTAFGGGYTWGAILLKWAYNPGT